MKSITVDPSTLIEREDNPNKMEPEKVELLAKLIHKWGFLQPILVREVGDGKHEIVDGHHRVRAAQMAEEKAISAVVLEEGEDANEAASILQISMNQIRGELDLGMVGDALGSLRESGWSDEDLAMTGFSSDEIDDLISATTIDEEDVMSGAALPEEEEDDDSAPKPFAIELTFSNKEEYTLARKALKRAAGKGKELSDGLLNLIGAQ